MNSSSSSTVFDLLRQAHPGLNAVLKLRGDGKDKELRIDLTDPAVEGPMVIDLARFAELQRARREREEWGRTAWSSEKTISPIPEIPVRSGLARLPQPATTGRYAYIEPGTEHAQSPGRRRGRQGRPCRRSSSPR